MVIYKVRLKEQYTSIRFDKPESMLRYVHSLNEKGIKYELEFERYGDESKDVPAAPLRQPDGVRGSD